MDSVGTRWNQRNARETPPARWELGDQVQRRGHNRRGPATGDQRLLDWGGCKGDVVNDQHEEWLELCRQASVEQDPAKLLRLVSRINELLEAKDKRLRPSNVRPTSNGDGVFQIAYDETLVITRAELLRNRGYQVSSALGNDGAKRILDKRERYRLFIVGHAAPRETREEIVGWLKANFPGTKILALNPPHHAKLAEADYNVILNGPEEWLSAVANAAA